jgi:glutamate synthase (NADPH/NADH) large chain
MVDLDPLDEEDIAMVKRLLENHIKYTNSSKAINVMDNITEEIKKFIKVYPKEFKAIIEQQKKAEKEAGLTERA